MIKPESRGATIRIFLVDGTPQGLRVVERLGWTGSCLAFARADFVEARARPEAFRTGVYVLLGPDPDGLRTQRVYVGEADEVRTRLDAHQINKDFWTHGFILSTKDESLNKAHVRYLESRLLDIARAVDNASLENGTAPPTPRLSEPEVAEMEAYLEEALTLFPLVGVNVFDLIEDVATPSVTPDLEDAEKPAEEPEAPGLANDQEEAEPVKPADGFTKFYLASPFTEAEGRDDSRGFLVYEGARAREETKVMLPGYKQLRDRLIEEKALVPDTPGQLRLTKSVVFDSPSAAASVLSGGSKNGRTEWKDAEGKTLKQHQEQSTS